MTRVGQIAISIFLSCSLASSSVLAQTKKKEKKPKSTKDELMINVPALKPKETEEYITPAAKAKTMAAETVNESVLPQYYWQARSGQFLASPFFEGAYFKKEGTFINGAPGGAQYAISGQYFRPGIEAEYGIFGDISLGGRLSYIMQSTNEDVGSINGVQDLFIYTKGNWAFSSGSLHYGIKIGFSPSDRTEDGQGNNNGFSGGPTYIPYLGYSKKFSSGFVGIDISYDYKGDRTTETQLPTGVTTKKTLEGGHVLSVMGFYEKMGSDWNFGTYVGFTSASSKEYKAPNQTNPTPLDGGSNFIIGAYTPMMYGDMILTPKLEFFTFMDDQLGNSVLDVNWQALARCDIRFSF